MKKEIIEFLHFTVWLMFFDVGVAFMIAAMPLKDFSLFVIGFIVYSISKDIKPKDI